MPPSQRPRMPPYLLMLVVSFALLGLIGYQTFKDRSLSGDLLQENQALQELLKKEEKKIGELQEDFTRLSTQKEQLNGLKDGLSGQLIELKRVKTLTDEGTKELESSLEFKENEVKDLKEKLALLDKTEQEIQFMEKEMMQQDAEIRVLKAQIEAFGTHLSEQLNGESANRNESALSDENDNLGKNETSKVSEKEKDALKIDEEDSTADAATVERSEEDSTVDAAMVERSDEHTEMSKEKNHTQDAVPEDEESMVDDREENSTNEMGEDGDEAEKNHDEDDTDEAEKVHDEDDTDEQHDIDMHAVTKFDLDENEMVSME